MRRMVAISCALAFSATPESWSDGWAATGTNPIPLPESTATRVIFQSGSLVPIVLDAFEQRPDTSIRIIVPPSKGVLGAMDLVTRTAPYTPSDKFDGSDSFAYTLFDGIAEYEPVVVIILRDIDGDGIPDVNDNCSERANPDQRDTDADGYGNACDGDLNNDGIVNVLDLGLFKQSFGTSNQAADLNGDGIVNALDLGLFRHLFGRPPGPSGFR